MTKKPSVFKCCWNCDNGLPACSSDKSREEQFNATWRFCCTSYPVSSHAENPDKRRWCKQFEPKRQGPWFWYELTAEEACRLNAMTTDEKVKYWRKIRTSESDCD